MNNDNPAEMTNEDLEKDMQNSIDKDKLTANQENVSKSTAAEGTLKTPEEDKSGIRSRAGRSEGEEQDLDDRIHRQAEEEMHNGNLPSPDDIPAWEDEDDDNKISG